MTNEQMATAELKKERIIALAETDHWCLSDRTPTPEQLAYRQAIRDMPTTISSYPFVDSSEWPTKP
jgi:hypothetical protein